MNSGDNIVIASTSEALIGYIQKRLEEIGANNTVYKALDEKTLHKCLTHNSPRFLFIENSFWHSATPLELLGLTNKYTSVRVYVFEVADFTENFVKRIVRVGIDGYLSIRKGQPRFRQELKEALNGKFVMPPEIENSGIDFLPETAEEFTVRDMEFISLICEEKDNEEIGKILKIKLQSVKNRRSKMYAKINVRNCVGLLKYLFRKRIIDLNEFLAS